MESMQGSGLWTSVHCIGWMLELNCSYPCSIYCKDRVFLHAGKIEIKPESHAILLQFRFQGAYWHKDHMVALATGSSAIDVVHCLSCCIASSNASYNMRCSTRDTPIGLDRCHFSPRDALCCNRLNSRFDGPSICWERVLGYSGEDSWQNAIFTFINVLNIPENGFLRWLKCPNLLACASIPSSLQITSGDLFVSGVFNGYLTTTPSHHARLPSPANINVVGGTVVAAGLDLINATYIRRSIIPFDAQCSSASPSSCTATQPDGVIVE